MHSREASSQAGFTSGRRTVLAQLSLGAAAIAMSTAVSPLALASSPPCAERTLPAASPAHVRVLISGGFSAAYQELLPQFEKSTGITVTTARGASEGGGPGPTTIGKPYLEKLEITSRLPVIRSLTCASDGSQNVRVVQEVKPQ
jgi:hypothetical protein